MLDLGANICANPAQLHQFALMGSAVAVASGVREPSVALLNIGSELHKGPPAVRAAASLVGGDGRLRYAGYIEPDRMFAGAIDIVVADGHTGNIALKPPRAQRGWRVICSPASSRTLPRRRPRGSALASVSAGCEMRTIRNATTAPSCSASPEWW